MRKALSALVATAMTPAVAFADTAMTNMEVEGARHPDNLAELSLEELLSQQVTSAAKKPQRLADTAAAIYVINQEQIAQSGARTLSDLLRMVPGFEVSEAEPSATAVSARGFASRYAANVLVMVDGAASYGSSLSGIFWDQAIFPLQDIERIEVIRGPGGSLWGSNSINGVVNVITKQGLDTQGVRANVKLGLDDLRIESGVGARLSDGAYAHVYATQRRHAAPSTIAGRTLDLDSHGNLVGLRLDLEPSADDTIVALGEYSTGRFDGVFESFALRSDTAVRRLDLLRNRYSTHHALARWTHAFSPDFDLTAQGYYNRLRRTEWTGRLQRSLYDLSVEGRWQASTRHELNFGVSGRVSDEKGGTAQGNSGERDHWLTGYVQDEIRLIPEKLILTLGSKYEVNDFGASNVQPSARALYHVGTGISVWAGVSRAVRTPLQIARTTNFSYGTVAPVPALGRDGFVLTTFRGNPDAKSEILTAYEAGIRGSIAPGWTFDIAAFYNRYRQLATQEVQSTALIFAAGSTSPIGLSIQVGIGNASRAESKGMEVQVAGSLAPWWQVEASYAFLDLDQTLTVDPAVAWPLNDGEVSARHQVRLRHSLEIAPNLHFNSFTHYIGPAPVSGRRAYTKQDLRLAWTPVANVELSAVGVDLLKRRRVEYRQAPSYPLSQIYVERTAYLEARLRF